jgi:hypothetical protein
VTLDEAVTIFERELPCWWWSVTKCWISCHATCGHDVGCDERDRDISDQDVEGTFGNDPGCVKSRAML